jgi:hypothetical protein
MIKPKAKIRPEFRVRERMVPTFSNDRWCPSPLPRAHTRIVQRNAMLMDMIRKKNPARYSITGGKYAPLDSQPKPLSVKSQFLKQSYSGEHTDVPVAFAISDSRHSYFRYKWLLQGCCTKSRLRIEMKRTVATQWISVTRQNTQTAACFHLLRSLNQHEYG